MFRDSLSKLVGIFYKCNPLDSGETSRIFRAKDICSAINELDPFTHPWIEHAVNSCQIEFMRTIDVPITEMNILGIELGIDKSSDIYSESLKKSLDALYGLIKDGQGDHIREHCPQVYAHIKETVVSYCVAMQDPQNHLGIKGRYVYMVNKRTIDNSHYFWHVQGTEIQPLRPSTRVIDVTDLVEKYCRNIEKIRSYDYGRSYYGDFILQPKGGSGNFGVVSCVADIVFRTKESVDAFLRNPNESLVKSTSIKNLVEICSNSLVKPNLDVDDDYNITVLETNSEKHLTTDRNEPSSDLVKYEVNDRLIMLRCVGNYIHAINRENKFFKL